jgi:hypothetical protein
MKIIFIVLLVAVLGAGTYYFFTRKNSSPSNAKELIVGKWKIDSVDISRSTDSSLAIIALVLAAADSNLHNYQFDISGDGLIIGSLNGGVRDTSYYEFASEPEFLLWSAEDSVKTKWEIRKLDSANLVVQSKDSVIFYFQKIKL